MPSASKIPDLFYRVETGYGSRLNRKWSWKASALRRRDAEQMMFRDFLGVPCRVVSSDGSYTSYVPFGPLDPSERERPDPN